MTTGIVPAPITTVGGVLGGSLPNPAFSAATELRFSTLTANDQAGAAYTLAAGDAGNIVRMTNAAANVVTVPDDATVNFPVGTLVEVQQAGAGSTSIAAAGGVTLFTPNTTLVLDTQYATVTLRKVAANIWTVDGRLRVTSLVTVNSQVGVAYTLALTDANGLVSMNNAAANVLTVPANATVPFSIGTSVQVYQAGVGQTSLAAAAGVTLREPNGWVKIGAQFGQASLLKIAQDEWIVEGRLAA